VYTSVLNAYTMCRSASKCDVVWCRRRSVL